MNSQNRVIAILPAYNEEAAIAKVILAAQPHVGQVVVVDDGSTDFTPRIAERMGVVVPAFNEEGAMKVADTVHLTVFSDAITTTSSFLSRLSGSLNVIDWCYGVPSLLRPSREDLLRWYDTQSVKVKDIAKTYGVNRLTVFRWLREYHIPTRTSVRFAKVKFPESLRGPFDLTNTGLYDGDGIKNTPGRIGFTNANLDLVEDQVQWFDSLGVERNALKFRIAVADESTHAAFKEEICRRFGVTPEQFWKPDYIRGVQNVVNVIYVNSEFARQFHRFRERVRIGITNPSEAADYLKGVFAADGGAHAGKRHGCFVAFSFNAKLERHLEREYRRCLGLLGVTPTADIHGSDGRLRVFLHESVVKLYRAGIFDLHISAKEAVERYLRNFKGPGARRNATLQVVFNACQELTSSGGIVNAKSVGRRIGRRPGTAAYHLAELVSRGRVVRTKRTKPGGYVYNLPK